MTISKPDSATVHNHFSRHSFTFPPQLKPQVVPAEEPQVVTPDRADLPNVLTKVTPTHSIIDVQSPADKAAGSSVSSF